MRAAQEGSQPAVRCGGLGGEGGCARGRRRARAPGVGRRRVGLGRGGWGGVRGGGGGRRAARRERSKDAGMLPRGRPMHRAACAAEPSQRGARARAEAFGARGAARRAGGAGGAGRGRPPPGARHWCRGRRHGCSRAAPSSRRSRSRRRCAQHARRRGCYPAAVRCTVQRARRRDPGRRLDGGGRRGAGWIDVGWPPRVTARPGFPSRML